MTDIQIPDEVVEAALEAFAHASGLGLSPDDENDEDWREDLQNGMRAALRAGLKAWPGMVNYRGGWEPVVHNHRKPHIILPLDGEA